MDWTILFWTICSGVACGILLAIVVCCMLLNEAGVIKWMVKISKKYTDEILKDFVEEP